MNRQRLRSQATLLGNHILLFLKWTVISVAVGALVGGVSTLFAFCLQKVTAFRGTHPWTVLLLPAAGLLIVFLYRRFLGEDRGTNQVLAEIHARDDVPWKMAPLIFSATLLTHLCGGSAGREGAALQLGGSLGNMLGRVVKLDENDRRVVVMCGMSAAFAAVFGTPMAAAVFTLEVASVGVMYYAGLMPCVFAALTASRFAAGMGITPESFTIVNLPPLSVASVLKIVLVAVLCAGVSTLLCVVLHQTARLLKKHISNPYFRVAAGGAVMIAVWLILGNQDYHGAGVGLIERAMEGETDWYAFLLKMFLTAVTIGAGYKGGEIVPSFCVGATFGCLAGTVLGISPSLCAACGMIAVFCGVTNCPIASLLIAFELLGYGAMPYFLIVVAVSFLLSGYYGLYPEQTIVYSKYKTKFLNRHIND